MSKFTSLSSADVRASAPSVYASHAVPGVSDKYQFVDTAVVIDQMRDMGYTPVSANQSKVTVKNGGSGTYVKHVVKMVHSSFLSRTTDPRRNGDTARRVGDIIPQIILTNSHNRTSALHMSAGLFRLVCLNGMVAKAGDFASFRILHNDKEIHQHVADGVKLVDQLTNSVVMPKVEKMIHKELSEPQVEQFALAATFLKFGEARPAEAALMLAARRQEDEGRSLWAVINRIQENAVKGGYATTDAAGRNVTSRGINSAARDFDFNLQLWDLGDRVLESLS